MASIYDIDDYSASSSYKKDDIVKSGGLYWYALQDCSNCQQTPATTGGAAAYWGGMITAPTSEHASAGNVTSPHFIWTQSYNFSVQHAPKVKAISFGDGYEQRMKDGINNTLVNISLSFDGRKMKEATAIIHFLESRFGKDFFFFTPPSPYNTRKKFICREFSSSIVAQGVMSVSANFNEVP